MKLYSSVLIGAMVLSGCSTTPPSTFTVNEGDVTQFHYATGVSVGYQTASVLKSSIRASWEAKKFCKDKGGLGEYVLSNGYSRADDPYKTATIKYYCKNDLL